MVSGDLSRLRIRCAIIHYGNNFTAMVLNLVTLVDQ